MTISLLRSVIKPRIGFWGDGFDYYSYLRSFYFDQDLDFANESMDFVLLHERVPYHEWNWKMPTGRTPNPWSIGPAILWSPFFLIQTSFAKPYFITPCPTVPVIGRRAYSLDFVTEKGLFPGYSQGDLTAISLATLFYSLAAIFLMLKICCQLFDFEVSALSVFALTFATPLIYYAIYEPLTSHALSAFGVALFLFVWLKNLGRKEKKDWILTGVTLGLVSLIRWQEALFAIFPMGEVVFLTSRSWRGGEKKEIVTHLRNGFLTVILALLIFIPQFFIWKHIFGAYLVIPQRRSFFNFSSPQIIPFLVSSWHGLFYWHPIFFLAIFGFIPLFLKNRLLAVLSFLGTFSQVYFNSSLRDWRGSDSFGARRMVDCVPIFALGLAALISSSRKFFLLWVVV